MKLSFWTTRTSVRGHICRQHGQRVNWTSKNYHFHMQCSATQYTTILSYISRTLISGGSNTDTHSPNLIGRARKSESFKNNFLCCTTFLSVVSQLVYKNLQVSKMIKIVSRGCNIYIGIYTYIYPTTIAMKESSKHSILYYPHNFRLEVTDKPTVCW
jgi:hypothetical protein